MKNQLVSSVFILVLFLGVATSRAQQQTLTPEMVVSLQTISAATIDPTGKNVAYILRTPEEETGVLSLSCLSSQSRVPACFQKSILALFDCRATEGCETFKRTRPPC